MPLDPTISLGVQAPKFDSPLEQAGKFIALRDMMSQNALRQQQIQQSVVQTQDLQAQARQRERDLADQQLVQESFLRNKDNPDVWGTVLKETQGRITPTASLALEKVRTENLNNASIAGENKNKLDLAKLTNVDNWLTALGQKDESQRPTEYDNGIARWSADPEYAPVIQKYTQLGLLPKAGEYDPRRIMGVHAAVIGAKGVLEENEKRQQIKASQAAEASSKASTLKSNLDIAGQTAPDGTNQQVWDLWRNKLDSGVQDYIPTAASPDNAAAVRRGAVAVEKQPEFGIKEAEYQALKKKTPQEWDAEVDAAIPPTEHPEVNAATKALRAAAIKGGSFTAAQAALKDGVDQIGRTLTAVASAKATQPIRIETGQLSQQASAMANMTEDDYRRVGEQFALSGVMPPMGLGSAARGKIQHYAQEFARENGLSPREMVVMQAGYQGDKASLSKLQATRDMVVTAETTANKNLDQFLSTAGKVIDSKSPWINKPLREINRDLLGSADQVAYDTARNVAVVEIGKVLNQVSGSSGSGVLSDSARKEVSDLIGPNATLEQIVKAANILKTDMKNRHDSMDAILGQIKDRIGALPPGPSAGAAAPPTNRKPLSEIFKQ